MASPNDVQYLSQCKPVLFISRCTILILGVLNFSHVFCVSLFQGITPILPIFREGILNGPPELKENASIGLGEVINRTSAEALKPSVVNITGPLIRILGDRFSFNVKVAVLDTLGLLLGKVGHWLQLNHNLYFKLRVNYITNAQYLSFCFKSVFFQFLGFKFGFCYVKEKNVGPVKYLQGQ